MIGRALARKCPACGQGDLALSFLKMNQTCPVCCVTYWSDEGEWTGPVIVNCMLGFGAAFFAWGLTALLDFSETLQIILPGIAIVTISIGAMPWTRSFWTLFLFLNGEIRPARN
jgi:uncharacterized protein (DUF983 family)